MDSVKNLRLRYAFALSLTAVVVCACFVLLGTTIERQRDYGRLISLAGSQLGLVHRIAFFAETTQQEATEVHFNTAQQQLRRAVYALQANHRALLNGDPANDIPKIETPFLNTILFDPLFGLDEDIELFVERAQKVASVRFDQRDSSAADIVYLSTVGPYTIAPLIAEVQTELERFQRHKMVAVQTIGVAAAAVAVLVLILQVFFVFRPFEKRLSRTLTELSETEVALRHKAIAAERAAHSKTNFLQNISHELRTPLNAICGFSDALLQGVYGDLTARQHEPLKNVKQSGDYLINLVSELLDISAAEVGSMRLDETPVPLKALAEDVSGQLISIAHNRDVSVTVRGPETTVYADPKRVRQVMINLVHNAIKYSPHGGNVTLAVRDPGSERPGFAVIDEGVGMTAQEVVQARQRFGRTESALLSGRDGTGLGLSICIEIMAAHGGEIEIQSEKGKGTTVSALFPPERRITDETDSKGGARDSSTRPDAAA